MAFDNYFSFINRKFLFIDSEEQTKMARHSYVCGAITYLLYGRKSNTKSIQDFDSYDVLLYYNNHKTVQLLWSNVTLLLNVKFVCSAMWESTLNFPQNEHNTRDGKKENRMNCKKMCVYATYHEHPTHGDSRANICIKIYMSGGALLGVRLRRRTWDRFLSAFRCDYKWMNVWHFYFCIHISAAAVYAAPAVVLYTIHISSTTKAGLNRPRSRRIISTDRTHARRNGCISCFAWKSCLQILGWFRCSRPEIFINDAIHTIRMFFFCWFSFVERLDCVSGRHVFHFEHSAQFSDFRIHEFIHSSIF